MFQDINDLKIKSNAFFIAMAEKCTDGWRAHLSNNYTIYDPSDDFCGTMLHGSKPIIPLPPLQKKELFEASYHASVDVFAPLFKTGESVELVISLLHQTMQSYNWEQFYKQSFEEVITNLNEKPHLHAILAKNDTVQNKRKISYSSRSPKDDTEIKKVAEDLIPMLHKIDPNEERVWLEPLMVRLTTKAMVEQKDMAERMLQKLDSAFGLDVLHDNTVEISQPSSDLIGRVALFREQEAKDEKPPTQHLGKILP